MENGMGFTCMHEITDEQLFSRFQGGETRAFETLYRRYRQPLYLYLLRSCATREEAEDLYQEAWSRLIGARKTFNRGNFRAYLFQAARNLLIDRYRKQRLQLVGDPTELNQLEDPDPPLDQQAGSADCGERLKQLLGQLPQEQRDAFLLKEEAGLTLEQIATMVKVGRETIKSRLRYALKRLRRALEDCL